MNEMTVFNNPEFGEIRTMIIDDEPWFVGRDVTHALGYSDRRRAVAQHVYEDDRAIRPITDSLGRTQETVIINESGVYALIFGSKLESAKKFKRWVTSEVLPSIRKTGSYGTPAEQPTDDMISISILNKILPVVISEVGKSYESMIPKLVRETQKSVKKPKWYANHMNISKEMTQLMLQHGISDRQLAKMSGVGYGSVRRYRIGENNCPPEKAKMILDVLHNL